jgi:hypothetical protein
MQVFGGGSLIFVGSGRYGDAAQFPADADGGPVNRYATGTFYFEPVAESPVMTIRLEGGQLTLNWTGGGVLQRADDAAGPWTEVTGAVSGTQLDLEGNQGFFRVGQGL